MPNSLATMAAVERDGGQPGEAETGGEEVEGQVGSRRHPQIPGDQQGARGIHESQHQLAAIGAWTRISRRRDCRRCWSAR